MFRSLPDKPNHPVLEDEILEQWQREDTFQRMRIKNAGGPRFSFIDGPVTANKTLGVHTAWGRTLKDVFQRYKALRGFHQRYQNGFDCQGLWIEVGCREGLGLNSKREIEEYGLEEFAKKCREVVEWSSAELTRALSGSASGWTGADYFTFSDTNIEYIWRFLRDRARARLAVPGPPADEWCPRCGTSISAHELVGSYVAARTQPCRYGFRCSTGQARPSSSGPRPRGRCRPTLRPPSSPDAQYGRRDGDWMSVTRTGGFPSNTMRFSSAATWSVGAIQGRSTTWGRAQASLIRWSPWDEVSMDEGTGIVHIAPGCGTEDFVLAGEHGLPALTPVDESGRFNLEYRWLAGMSTAEAAQPIIES